MEFKIKKRDPIEKFEWHEWFAWYPVRVDKDTIVWLRPILRRLAFDNRKEYNAAIKKEKRGEKLTFLEIHEKEMGEIHMRYPMLMSYEYIRKSDLVYQKLSGDAES